MLDLEPGVHLEEGERAALVEEELARARALVADRACEPQRRLAHPLPQVAGVTAGERRLLEDLLVTTLERAVAFAEVDAAPVAIEQDLDLDVPRAFDQALEDEAVVAERGCRLATRGSELVGEPVAARGRCACPCRRRRRPA